MTDLKTPETSGLQGREALRQPLENADGSKTIKQPHYVDDYRALSEGDHDPSLKKDIKTLIIKDEAFIVYLDKEMCVQWSTNRKYDPARFSVDFGKVTNRIGLLESLSKYLLSDPQLEIIRRLLGEGMARLIDDSHSANAQAILDEAEKYLRDRSVERGRIWYISAAAVATILILLFTFLFWIFRDSLLPNLGYTAIEVAIGTGLGSLGAFISILLRIAKLNIDSLAGMPVHLFEGAIRIIAGTAGALLFAVAIKSNLILGAINSQEKSLALLVAICLVAGASERLVPNLIKNIEGTVLGDSSIDKEGRGSHSNSAAQQPPAPEPSV